MVYVPIQKDPIRNLMQYVGLSWDKVASLGDFKDYIKTPQADDPDYKDWLRQQLHEKEQPPEKPPEPPKPEPLTS